MRQESSSESGITDKKDDYVPILGLANFSSS